MYRSKGWSTMRYHSPINCRVMFVFVRGTCCIRYHSPLLDGICVLCVRERELLRLVPFSYQLSCVDGVCVCVTELLHQIPFPLVRYYTSFVCERELLRLVSFSYQPSCVICVYVTELLPRIPSPLIRWYMWCVCERESFYIRTTPLSSIICRLCVVCVCERVVPSSTIHLSAVIYHTSLVCSYVVCVRFVCVRESCCIRQHPPVSCHVSNVVCVYETEPFQCVQVWLRCTGHDSAPTVGRACQLLTRPCRLYVCKCV